MKNQIPKDIVFTYFAGNASVLQKKLIEEWLSTPDHAEVYFEWLQEWETTQPQFLPDATQAFKKFSKRTSDPAAREIYEGGEADVSESGSVFSFLTRWQWVAVIVLSLGIGSYSLRSDFLYKTYSTSYKKMKTVILDDSTKVTLNSNSKLKVPRWGFGSRTREVVLEGEAEFAVTHTIDNKHFIVHTADNSSVTVLGTEFVVYSRMRGTRVVLNKGKVQLASAKDPKPHEMIPGDRAEVTLSGVIEIKKLTKEELSTPSVWKQHEFKFQRTSLAKAATEMKEIFGVSIIISNDTLAARELTGTFKAQNADELLIVLSEMLDMEFSFRDGKLYLAPKP